MRDASQSRRAILTAGVAAVGSTLLRPGDSAARELGAGRSS
jgi:hypothetical protein